MRPKRMPKTSTTNILVNIERTAWTHIIASRSNAMSFRDVSDINNSLYTLTTLNFYSFRNKTLKQSLRTISTDETKRMPKTSTTNILVNIARTSRTHIIASRSNVMSFCDSILARPCIHSLTTLHFFLFFETSKLWNKGSSFSVQMRPSKYQKHQQHTL